MFLPVLVAGLIAGCPGVSSGRTQSPRETENPALRVVDRPAKEEPRVSISLSRVSYAEVLTEIHRLTGATIVSDAFPDDPRIGRVSMTDTPLSAAVSNLAALFGRDAVQVGGTYVLVHRQSVAKIAIPNPLFPWTVRPSGELEAVPEEALPTVRGSLIATTLGRLAQEATRASRTRFSVEPGLAERRVHVCTRAMTVTDLAMAVSLLVGGRAEARIVLSEADRKRRDERLRDQLDARTAEDKLSDELKEAIAPVLTPQERRTLSMLGSVEIDPARLSGRGRSLANEYLRKKWDLVLADPQGLDGRSLDPSRGFSLHLQPVSHLRLGIHAFLNDGTPIAF